MRISSGETLRMELTRNKKYKMRTLCGIILAAAAFGAAVAADGRSDASRMGAEVMNPGGVLRCMERIGGGEFRVLIYGNSIALHAPKADIGWTYCWGMAASAAEKDFAHLVVAGLESQLGKKADLRIRNLAVLERNFATNIATVAEIAADADWKPDYVVIAIGENAPNIDTSNAVAYRKFLADIARPFAEGGAKVVLRSPFWMNAEKAECTANAAAEVGAVYVDVGPLGFKNENKAIGLFSHGGVANHPGDLGMKRLADLIIGGFNAATENPVEGAAVRFAGGLLKVERCRVSAVPFNRVWPGCQRSMDQTRLSSFVGFDVPEGGGTLEVDFGANAPESARIRPFSRSQPVCSGGVWSVRIDRPEQFVVEFDGGGELHVFADPPWRDVANGPNVMRFGPGEHHPGAIIPKSGDTIVIERGATVYGNLVLTGVDDVTVVGRGILDGSRRPRVDFDYAGSRHLAEVGDKLGESSQGLFNLRDVRRRRAAGALEQLVCLDAAHHFSAVDIRERGKAECHILHDFNEYAAQAEHHHRTVLGIGGNAADHLSRSLDHFLNDDAFKPVGKSPLGQFCNEIRVLGAQFCFGGDVHAYAADIGFVRCRLAGHLHHHGVADAVCDGDSLLDVLGKARSAGPHAVGGKHIHAFSGRELSAVFSERG